MKNLLWMAVVISLAACTKNVDKQASVANQQMEKQSCDFGITSFNLTKRAPVDNGEDLSNHRPKGAVPATPATGVLLLDFDGQLVTGTAWNVFGDINCAPANLTAEQKDIILQRVTNDYSPFNILVTTDEATYNAANIYKRQRVIITESWEWYGSQAGGVSYLNTFTQGTNTPCFIFSSLLNYNTKNIAEACSHEAGHTFGLRHQALYDANCNKITDYNSGAGSGETGWAPIMGVPYYENMTLWHNGTNSLDCHTFQDDEAVIATIVGFKNDDYANSTTNAALLTTSLSGTIANNTDVDFFAVKLTAAKTISLAPYSFGASNLGANEDLVLKVYNSQGVLTSTINDPGILNASVSLNAGSYFVSVSTAPNSFATTYGMLGKYTIAIN